MACLSCCQKQKGGEIRGWSGFCQALTSNCPSGVGGGRIRAVPPAEEGVRLGGGGPLGAFTVYPVHIPSPLQRTTMTGRSVRWITLCAVLPSIAPVRSPLPLEPMMMRLASCSWASLTISRAASLPMGFNSRLGQRIAPSPDRLPCLLVRLDRCQPQPAELPLPQVQHPDLSLGHGGQLLGRCDHPRGDLRLVNGGQQSVVHRYA